MSDRDSDGGNGNAKKSAVRQGRALLIGSLALNLFLAGVIVASLATGAAWRYFSPGDPPRFHGPISKHVLDELSDSDRQAYRDVRRVMRDNFRQARPIIRDLRAARREAAEALAADPYVPADVEAAFKDIRDLTGKLTVNMQSGMVAALADAPPEVRKKFAEHLKRGPHGRKHGKRPREDENERMDAAPPPDMMP